MADSVTGLFARGQTYNGPNKTLSSSYGTSVGVEGKIVEFPDLSPATTSGVRTKRSDRVQKCIAVRNVSGFTVLPKRLVKWASGYVGRRIDGYTTVTDDWAAGVVDEYLPSTGARDEDIFWLQVSGPALCKMPLSTAAADISQGAWIVSITGATSQCTTSGRIELMLATSDQTTIKTQLLNKIGRALSSVSSSSTNGDCLVALQLLKD